MGLQRCVLLSLVLVGASCVAFGQTAATNAGPAGAEGSRLDELRARGYEALYNLDYEDARRIFRVMSEAFPDHPAGPQCLAAALWLEELNRARHLQASLYSAESFAARADEKPDPRTVEQFRQLTRQAKSLAEARLRRDKRDVEALYFLGATEGLKAVFAAAAERRFMDALSDASEAAELHRQVLKLDPSYRDAELTIGMHNYILGSLPLPLKLLASVGGMRGSKKRGLEAVERVAREGRWARDVARLLLIDLYKREKRWAEAASVARELGARYPRNYLLQLQAADALVAQAATLRRAKNAPHAAGADPEREAFRIFDSLLRERAKRNAVTDLVHFRYGEALLAAGQPDRAAREFLAPAERPTAPPDFATLARLRAAQSLDLAGKRADALAAYRAVLSRPNFQRSHEEARRGLRETYRRQDR